MSPSSPSASSEALRLFQARNYAQAETAAEQALKQDPRDTGTLNVLGQIALATARPAEAVVHFREAIRHSPELPNLHFNLALAHQATGALAEAIEAVQAAIRLDANVPVLVAKLGQLLCHVGANEDAIPILRRALEMDRKSVPVRVNLAQALSESGQPTEAEKFAREALFLSPKDPTIHRLLGRICQLHGRSAEAAKFFDQAVALAPDAAASYFTLVYSRKIRPEDESLVAKMASLAEQPHLSEGDQELIHYALGKAMDDLGRYEAALPHFDRANERALASLHRKGRRYEPSREEAETARRIAAFASDAPCPNANPTAQPIFIVGMIRSGTTLMEQILSSHSAIAGAGELSFWMAADRGWFAQGAKDDATLESLGLSLDDYLARLQLVGEGAEFITDKMPLNFLAVGLIRRTLPNAKIVHIQRHPVDTALSTYVTPYRGSPIFGHSRANIVHAYRQYQALANHWRSTVPQNRWIDVAYERVVEDREAEARRILDFLGLPWDPACLEFDANKRYVNTPSTWQVRQPVYRTSLERWRNYEPWLGELRALMP